MNDPAHFRLFVAVPAPSSWTTWLRAAQQQLERDVPGYFRWTPRDSWHITVHFLGNQPVEYVPFLQQTVREVAAASRPLTLTAKDVGAPGSIRRPRLTWLQCDDQGVLASAQRGLLGHLSETPTELHPFRAHITLGRARQPSPIPFERAITRLNALPRPAPARVSELILFRSHLEQRGARYEPLERSRLGG